MNKQMFPRTVVFVTKKKGGTEDFFSESANFFLLSFKVSQV